MSPFVVLVLVVGLPIVVLALLDWERSHRPKPPTIVPARSHVRPITAEPVEAERPRSLAVDAWSELAGGTEIEARVYRARRMLAQHRTFGDQPLRRTR